MAVKAKGDPVDGLVPGLMVNYVWLDGSVRPGVVVRVFPEAVEGKVIVSLSVFVDGVRDDPWNGAAVMPFADVRCSEEPLPGTWHWPERA